MVNMNDENSSLENTNSTILDKDMMLVDIPTTTNNINTDNITTTTNNSYPEQNLTLDNNNKITTTTILTTDNSITIENNLNGSSEKNNTIQFENNNNLINNNNNNNNNTCNSSSNNIDIGIDNNNIKEEAEEEVVVTEEEEEINTNNNNNNLQESYSSLPNNNTSTSPITTTASTPIPITTTPPLEIQVQTSTSSLNPTPRLTCAMHRKSYVMTQLGGQISHDTSQSKLLDENDPETGMGYKNPGPQGFLSYTTEQDLLKIKQSSVNSLSSSSVSIHNNNNNLNHSALNNGVGNSNSRGGQSPIDRKIKLSNSSSNVDVNTKHHKDSTSTSNLAMALGSSVGSSTGTKRKSNHRPLSRLQKNEEERRKRKEQKRQRARDKPLYVGSIQELPPECIKMIKKSKIPEEKLINNFHILLPILRFRTGFNLRLSNPNKYPTTHHSRDNLNSSSNSVGKDSNLISPDNTTGDVNSPLVPIQNTTTTTTTTTITTTTTTVSTNNSNNNNNNNASNENEIDDYDDGSRLENSFVPKGTTDLFDKTHDVKKIYKNLKQIGSGGFGSVFLAKSTLDKCEIAIKKIPHHSAKAQRTNLNEIGYLHFCKHPNIVNYLRSHLVDDNIWIAMEYMHGGTLTEASQGHSFNESCIAFVAKGMLEGLHYLHSHQLVHRDIKSGNIMMTIEGKIKIVDFGLCVDSTERKLTHMAGSPFWMSPEMIRGDGYSCPSDIWSFAICLLELANGEPPNRKSSLNAMFTIATSGCHGLDKTERWTDNFKNFLNLCLEVDPQKRATAEQLLKHPWIHMAEHPETMKKILAQIFIANVMNHLDPI